MFFALLLKKEITRICFFKRSNPSSSILRGVGATRNRAGVTSFTFLSVAWAESITATANVKSFVEYNSDRISMLRFFGTISKNCRGVIKFYAFSMEIPKLYPSISLKYSAAPGAISRISASAIMRLRCWSIAPDSAKSAV